MKDRESEGDIIDTTQGGEWIKNKEGFFEFIQDNKNHELGKSFGHEIIESRKPILDQESVEKYDFGKIDKQWTVITEHIRRNILEDIEVRKTVAQYAKITVSESLPYEFLLKISLDDKEVSGLIDRYKSLIDFLNLPPVPDEHITPDITHSHLLRIPQAVIKRIEEEHEGFYKGIDPREVLQKWIDEGAFRGVTFQERGMIARRYRFARDVKMLALIADSLSHYDSVPIGDQEKMILPSGIRIILNTEDDQEIKGLTNPAEWLKRKQLKDRVYQLQVGKSQYLLKEKKTDRHTDTKKYGHHSIHFYRYDPGHTLFSRVVVYGWTGESGALSF